MDRPLSDGRARRVADDSQLVCMGRTLERLFGEEALLALVAHNHARTRAVWEKNAVSSGRQDPGYLKCLFNPDAHDFEIIRDDDDCLEVKVTRCVHAEVFRSYNAPDLGEKLVCSGDHAVVEGYSPGIELVRPTTCMTGDCCHFVFRRKQN